MKFTGIVRCLDDLGRIVIPIETRRALHIENRDPIEIYVRDDEIILKKYMATCVFCGSNKGLIEYERHTICRECIEKLNETK